MSVAESRDPIHLQPLVISPSEDEFEDPETFLTNLYTNPKIALERRGAVLVNIPEKFIYDEAPEVDQSQKLSWICRQNLRRGSVEGVWLYTDVETSSSTSAKSYLDQVDVETELSVEEFWRTCGENEVLNACFCIAPFFKNSEITFKNLPRWDFGNLKDLIGKTKFDFREKNYFISNCGAVCFLNSAEMNLGTMVFKHWGSPTEWTVVPAKYFRVMQNCIAQFSPVTLKTCPTLHTLSALYEPKFFEERRIPFLRFQQKPGQLAVFAYQAQVEAIHLGVDVSESCLYAEKHWLRYATHQVECRCDGGNRNDGKEIRDYGFKKYPEMKVERNYDPTDIGIWYCGRNSLPEKCQGKSFPKNKNAFRGIPESLPVSSNSEKKRRLKDDLKKPISRKTRKSAVV